jgi:hypothetical protein
VTIALVDVPAAARPHIAQIKHLLGCFSRHFTGRAHAACDRRLLAEIIERLEGHAVHIAELATLRGAVDVRLGVLRSLLREIETVVPPPDEVAGNLALRANQQFLLFRRLVSGRPQRRRAAVERIAANLAEIEREMTAHAAATNNPAQHAANLALVTRELARARTELQDPAMETSSLPPAEQHRLLAAAANAEREDYRESFMGRDRNTVDIEQLAGICDRVGELALQLAALPAPIAGETLQQVSLNLDAFEVEFNALCEQRKRFVSFTHVVQSAAALRAQLMAVDAPESVRKHAVAQLDALLADPLVSELVGVTGP